MVKRINQTLPWLSNIDTHMREVIQGSAIAVLFRSLGIGLTFAFSILLARLLGAEKTGIYYLALSTISFAVVFGRMGLEKTLIRFIATNVVLKKWQDVAGVYKKAVLISAGISILISAVVYLAAPWISEYLYSEPLLKGPLRLMTISILPMTLVVLHSAALRGLKKIFLAMLLNGVLVPAFGLLFIAIFVKPFGVSGAVFAHVIATVLSFSFGFIFWRKSTPQIKNIKGSFDTHQLLKTSWPLFLIVLMGLLMNQISTVLLGIFNDSSVVGIYNIAFRTALLTQFILVAMNSIAGPKFAELHAQENYLEMGKLAQKVVIMGSFVAAFIVLPLIFKPDLVLSLFGDEFKTGARSLQILAIGQFVNVASGPVGMILLMSGHEKFQRNNVFASVVMNLFLSAILIPKFGITGAAVGISTAMIFKNIRAIFLVNRHLSIKIWSFSRVGKSHSS